MAKITKTGCVIVSYTFKCGCTHDHFIRASISGKGRGRGRFNVCPEHKEKIIVFNCRCVDCGYIFSRSPRANKRIRCGQCQYIKDSKHRGGREYQKDGFLWMLSDNNYAMSLREVSDVLGISGERVRQIQNVALIKFKKRFKKLFGNPFEHEHRNINC